MQATALAPAGRTRIADLRPIVVLILAAATMLAYGTSFVVPRGEILFQIPGWVTPVAALLTAASAIAVLRATRPSRAAVGLGAAALVSLLWGAGGVPFDLSVTGSWIVSPDSTRVDWPMVATRACAAASAVLLFGVVVRHWRELHDRCVHCGQAADRPVAEPRIWLGYLGVLFSLPYIVVKTNWALGGTLGLDYSNLGRDGFTRGWLTVPMALIGVVLSLALVHRWGRIWPRWVPGLAGRRTPRWLLLFGGWFGTALLLSVGLVGSLDMIGDAMRGELWVTLGGMHAWAPVLFYASWFCWALVFAPATRGYQLRTQPPCRACGLAPDPAGAVPVKQDESVPALRPLRPFVARTTYRRWTHLVLGGALAVPYLAVAWVLGVVLRADSFRLGLTSLHAFLVQAVFVLAAVSATALLPAARRLAGVVARELLGGPSTGMPIDEARSWPDRWRTAGWFVLHLGTGTVIGFLTLAVPPMIVLLLIGPLLPKPNQLFADDTITTAFGAGQPWSPLVGLALVVAGFYLVAGVGAVLAKAAPALLGPSARDRLAERVRELSQRNRIASELHDSVGHTLSVVTLQAAAAAQLLDRDPGFTREALAVIEESSRVALADLDGALAVLRDAGEQEPTTPRGLAHLDALARSTDLAGLTVHIERAGELDRVPERLGREAHRIVREALTNVLRHAESAPATVRIEANDDRLSIVVINPLSGQPRPNPRTGTGIRDMRERVAALGGSATAGPEDGQWRLAAHLPLPSEP